MQKVLQDLAQARQAVEGYKRAPKGTLRVASTLELGADAAVRLGVPRSSAFIVRKLAEDVEIIVAAPRLLEQWAHVRRPHELAEDPWVAHTRLVKNVKQRYLGPKGARDEFTSSLPPRVTASNVEGLRAFVLSGLGFAVMPTHLIAEQLRTSQFVRVLPEWYRRKVNVYLLLPSRQHPQRTVVFIEALLEAVRRSRVLQASPP